MPIYRRIPKRGFTNARFRTDYTTINVDKLNAFQDGDTVDLAAILERGLVSKNTNLLKILGNGDLQRKLIVRAQKCSSSAAEKILAAGGQIIAIDDRGRDLEGQEAPAAATNDATEPTEASAEADEAPADENETEDSGSEETEGEA